MCRGTALPVAGALRSSSPHHKLKWFRLLLPLHELNRFMIMTMMTRADATAVGPRRIATSTAKVSLVSSILLCCSGMMILGMITPVTAAPLRLLRRQRQTWSTSTTNSSNAAAHPSGGLLLLETRNDDGCPTPDFSFSMAASPYPTSFPVETSVPQEPAESQLLSWLTSETTPESVLLNPSTPQGQAYEWMLTSPTLASMTERRAQQVFALATLYFATGGATWTNNLGWLRFDNECEWAKVYCEAGDVDPTVLFTVNNDTFLAVKALHLGKFVLVYECVTQNCICRNTTSIFSFSHTFYCPARNIK